MKLYKNAAMVLALSMLAQQVGTLHVIAKTTTKHDSLIHRHQQLNTKDDATEDSILPSQQEVLSGNQHQVQPIVYTTTITIPIYQPVVMPVVPITNQQVPQDSSTEQNFEEVPSTEEAQFEIVNEPQAIVEQTISEQTPQSFSSTPEVNEVVTSIEEPVIQIEQTGEEQFEDVNSSPNVESSQPSGQAFESTEETQVQTSTSNAIVVDQNTQFDHEIDFVEEPQQVEPSQPDSNEDSNQMEDNDALVPGLDDDDFEWDDEFIEPPVAIKPGEPEDPEDPNVEPPTEPQPGPTPHPGDNYQPDDTYDPNLPGLPFDSIVGSEVYYPSNGSLSNSFVIISPSADLSSQQSTGRTIRIKKLNAKANRKVRVNNMGVVNLLPDFANAQSWRLSLSPYNTPSLWGQCTWFAWGRFYELYGFDPEFKGNGYDCVDELLTAHADKFERSQKPKAGAVFSSDVEHNHVGIVLDYNEKTDILTIQEGNLDDVSNPIWSDAIRDYRTIRLTSEDMKKLYGNVTYAVPKKDTKFVNFNAKQKKKKEKKTSGNIDANKVPLKQLTKGLVEKKIMSKDISSEIQEVLDVFQEFEEVVEK